MVLFIELGFFNNSLLFVFAGEQGEQELDRTPQGSDWRQGDQGQGAGGDPEHHHEHDAGDKEEEKRVSGSA